MRFSGRRRVTYFQEFIDKEDDVDYIRKLSEHMVVANELWDSDDYDNHENQFLWPEPFEKDVTGTIDFDHHNYDASEIVFVNEGDDDDVDEEDEEESDDNPLVEIFPVSDWESSSKIFQQTKVGKIKSSIQKSFKSVREGLTKRLSRNSMQPHIHTSDDTKENMDCHFPHQPLDQEKKIEVHHNGSESQKNLGRTKKQLKIWNLARKLRLGGKKVLVPSNDNIDHKKPRRCRKKVFAGSKLEEFVDTGSSSENSIVMETDVIQFAIPDRVQHEYC